MQELCFVLAINGEVRFNVTSPLDRTCDVSPPVFIT
jgi:hypothetical protein